MKRILINKHLWFYFNWQFKVRSQSNYFSLRTSQTFFPAKEPIPPFTGINQPSKYTTHWAQRGYWRTNERMNFFFRVNPGYSLDKSKYSSQINVHIYKYSFWYSLLICNENISIQSSFILHSTKTTYLQKQ